MIVITPTQCTIVVSSNCEHLLQRGMCPHRRTICWPLFKTCLYPRYSGSVDEIQANCFYHICDKYFFLLHIFYRRSKTAVILSSNPPSRCCEFGTVHNVKLHCPPHVSLWWVRVHSRCTKGVYQLCNPPCESGCWGIRKVVGSWAWLCHHREMNAI